jgi:dTDP-4-amino-4,6-dideoxygalactose transaminase
MGQLWEDGQGWHQDHGSSPVDTRVIASFREMIIMAIDFISKRHPDSKLVEKYLNMSKLDNQYANNGPVKQLLEERLYELLNLDSSKRVLCVSNGTAALSVIASLIALEMGEPTKMLSPSFTFYSALTNGNDVVLEDIESGTSTLSMPPATSSEEYNTLLLTNLFGTKVDIDYWVAFCKKNGKRLVFDNAASALSTHGGINVHSFGDYSFGSLHHTKYLGFGEGGFIVLNAQSYDTAKSLANFGGSLPGVVRLSSNYKMSDIAAAYILQHLDTFDVERYLEVQKVLIDTVKEFNVEVFNPGEGNVLATVPILRNDFQQSEFARNGLSVGKYYRPLRDDINSGRLYSSIINLPISDTFSDKTMMIYVEKIRKTLALDAT